MRRIRVGLVAVAMVVGAALVSPASAATPTCFGQTATIVGTDGADVLNGADSPGADVIVTLGGDDSVRAGGGDDLVCSGDGDDAVDGMKGEDTIDAGSGNDRVRGGYASDLAYLGDGNDTYDGDAGGSVGHRDRIYAGAGRDTVNPALDGPMTVHGGPGADTIRAFGPPWVDWIFGEGGADSIDVRDFDYYEGVYAQRATDHVRGGGVPSDAEDACVVNDVDDVTGCETTTVFADPPY